VIASAAVDHARCCGFLTCKRSSVSFRVQSSERTVGGSMIASHLRTTDTPEKAWQLVRARFPFPEFMERDKGHIGIGHTALERLPLGARILDFGAGACDKTAILASLGYNCTAADDLADEWHAIDNNREKIRAFAESFSIEFIQVDGRSLPFEPNYYDMVMLHDVLEHLHNSPRELLISLLTAVRPRGYLFATIPNHVNLRKRLDALRGRTTLPAFSTYYWYPDPWRGHVREYTRHDCEELVRYLDLEMVELRGVHHMLEKVPSRLIPLYVKLSRLAPDTRDTWSLLARKRMDWEPKPSRRDRRSSAEELEKRILVVCC
jgi:SAM-dependent methyltransferase